MLLQSRVPGCPWQPDSSCPHTAACANPPNGDFLPVLSLAIWL